VTSTGASESDPESEPTWAQKLVPLSGMILGTRRPGGSPGPLAVPVPEAPDEPAGGVGPGVGVGTPETCASVTPPFEHFGGGLTLASVLGFVSENHAASRTCQRLRVRVGSLERVMCQSAP